MESPCSSAGEASTSHAPPSKISNPTAAVKAENGEPGRASSRDADFWKAVASGTQTCTLDDLLIEPPEDGDDGTHEAHAAPALITPPDVGHAPRDRAVEVECSLVCHAKNLSVSMGGSARDESLFERVAEECSTSFGARPEELELYVLEPWDRGPAAPPRRDAHAQPQKTRLKVGVKVRSSRFDLATIEELVKQKKGLERELELTKREAHKWEHASRELAVLLSETKIEDHWSRGQKALDALRRSFQTLARDITMPELPSQRPSNFLCD